MEDRIYYCYKAINKVNGKTYIGFATDPQLRWREHKRDADKGRGYVFHDAIRKHGWEAFEFEVICCGKNKREMLEYVEPALIEQYQSLVGQNGYNVYREWRKNCIFSEDVCKKMSENHWSKRDPERYRNHAIKMRSLMKLTDNGRERLRIAKSGKQAQVTCPKCGVIGGNILMKHWHFDNCGLGASEKMKQKISKSNSGKKRSEQAKEKMRKSHLGKIPSKLTRRRVSESCRHFTEEQLDRICNSVKEGTRIVIIAEEFRTTRQTINRLRRKNFKYYKGD